MGQQATGQQDAPKEKPSISPIWIWKHEPPPERKCPAPINVKPIAVPIEKCGGCGKDDGGFRKIGSGDLVQRPGKAPIIINEKIDPKAVQ